MTLRYLYKYNKTVSRKEIVEGKDHLAGKILERTGVKWYWNFKLLDENNDNRLTFEEFCVTFETDEYTITMAEKMGFKPMQVISIKAIFDKMDYNIYRIFSYFLIYHFL